MGETFNDIVGGLFDIYKAKETAKIEARLDASRAQAVALETDAYLALQQQQREQAQAAGVPSWVTPLAIAGAGIALLWMMR